MINVVAMHPEDAAMLRCNPPAVKIGNRRYSVIPHDTCPRGFIAMNSLQREDHQLAFNDEITVHRFSPKNDFGIKEIRIGVTVTEDNVELVNPDTITKLVRTSFNNIFLNNGQSIVFDTKPRLRATVLMFDKNQEFGFVHSETKVVVVDLQTKSELSAPQVFRADWNFDSMGIGGLGKEFDEIFRRAFASRVFAPEVMSQLGTRHVKGLILHGPPGTGKTLMARQIGKMLNGREPKVINGPEVLSKYVGQSEENIRMLFADAEHEWKQKKQHSSLHILIFDELDAICAQRGSRGGGTGVGDTVVNQLLTKMDGVDALDNLLVIGMTNRLDMIDEALLRPGRFEVHMEIGLPDETGRVEILRIHTLKMTESGKIGEVDLADLAKRTKNFTGAEIEGLVRSATSFALRRHVSTENPSNPKDVKNIRVGPEDFEKALSECKPAFGVSQDDLKRHIPNDIIPTGAQFDIVSQMAMRCVEAVRNNTRTPLLTLLLTGNPGCGKTAYASHMALESAFPYARLVTAKSLLRFPESTRPAQLRRHFEDAHKSPLNILILDDIERMLDYVPIGPRFSNPMLQTLLIMLKEQPPPGHRLLVVATTSELPMVEDMNLRPAFNETLVLPDVDHNSIPFMMEAWGMKDVSEYLRGDSYPVKKLLTEASMYNN